MPNRYQTERLAYANQCELKQMLLKALATIEQQKALIQLQTKTINKVTALNKVLSKQVAQTTKSLTEVSALISN